MRDAALDGAVATVVAWRVQVLGHRPAGCGRKSFRTTVSLLSPKRLCYIHPKPSSDWYISFIPPKQPIPKHLHRLYLMARVTLPECTGILLSTLQRTYSCIVSTSLHSIYG